MTVATRMNVSSPGPSSDPSPDRPRRHGPSRSSADEGSGTMLGVILIMVVTVMISLIAGSGRILMSRSRAATAADLSSLSAANALWAGDDPCAVARKVADGHSARLVSCEVGGATGEDVTVEVSVDTGMPFLPPMRQAARAGPVACGDRPAEGSDM